MGHPSVPMHELLEAEFAVLHGKLPPDYRNSSDASVRLDVKAQEVVHAQVEF
jgi:hypothetical protein